MLKFILIAKSLPNSLLLTSGPDMSPKCLQKYPETPKVATNRLRVNRVSDRDDIFCFHN